MLRCAELAKKARRKGLYMIGLLLCSLSLSGCIVEEPAPGQGNIFEPEAGVSCDEGRQICYDRQGPDVRLTRRYFGDRAADRLERQLARGGAGNNVFEPEPGVVCNRTTKICYDQQRPDVRLTRTYFGDAAAQRLRRQIGDQHDSAENAFSPQPGVRCEPARQICFDREGASIDLTRQYFGEDAAERLANQIGYQRPAPPGYGGGLYEPERGVVCEAAIQICADRKGADVSLTRRYFGENAAERLIRQFNHRGTVFEPRSGISCDRSQAICYDYQGPDVQWTRLFFGENAAERLQRR